MPKISALAALTTAAADDAIPVLDDSASTTKKMTLTKLKEWLQSLAGWVTSGNLSLSTVQAKLAANFATSSATYVDSGFDITLPAAGTWLILGNLRGGTTATGRYPVARLYNETAAAAIADSDTMLCYTSAGGDVQIGASLNMLITTTTSNNVIRVDLKSPAAASVSLISDATGGYSRLLAIRIG